MARWGTFDIGVSDGNTAASFETAALWRVASLAGHLHSACVKGGSRTRFTLDAKYPTSSPPASVEPPAHAVTSHTVIRRQTEKSYAALVDAPLIASSSEPALPSVSGSSPRSLRQAPRARARAFPREPRDPGLPFRLSPGHSFHLRAPLRTTKNPPERLAREGPLRQRTVDLVQARSPPWASHAPSDGARPLDSSMRISNPQFIA